MNELNSIQFFRVKEKTHVQTYKMSLKDEAAFIFGKVTFEEILQWEEFSVSNSGRKPSRDCQKALIDRTLLVGWEVTFPLFDSRFIYPENDLESGS